MTGAMPGLGRDWHKGQGLGGARTAWPLETRAPTGQRLRCSGEDTGVSGSKNGGPAIDWWVRESRAPQKGPGGLRTRKNYWLFSVNHLSTVSLFSLTHLILAFVFSKACSRARVPEPKPVSIFSILNCSSCQENKDSQFQAGSFFEGLGRTGV